MHALLCIRWAFGRGRPGDDLPGVRARERGGQKFCGECGARLASQCPTCGTVSPLGQKFCGECGSAVAPGTAPAAAPAAGRFSSPHAYTPRHLAERILTSKTALEGERKQVTVLFADMKGSTELLADRDPEEARRILDPVLERMMEAVHRYEGTVNQVMGDGIMALFGAPLAHEDHAVRACYAALRMHEAIRRYTEDVRRTHGAEVQIRVGINSGDVVVRSVGSDLRMDYTAVGQTTHLAARMEQLAPAGTTRLTAETLRLAEEFVQVRPLGPIPVKGLAAPVEVFELTGAGAVRHAPAGRRGPAGSAASLAGTRRWTRSAKRPRRPGRGGASSSPSSARRESASRGSSTSSLTRTTCSARTAPAGACSRQARCPTARPRRSCPWPSYCAATSASTTATTCAASEPR
jgi:class 3 adenylate cyclase